MENSDTEARAAAESLLVGSVQHHPLCNIIYWMSIFGILIILLKNLENHFPLIVHTIVHDMFALLPILIISPSMIHLSVLGHTEQNTL
jgi:hypothetical protein